MTRAVKITGGVALLAAIAAVFALWPQERLPFEIDGERFLVNDSRLLSDEADGRHQFLFWVEHETGYFDPVRIDASFASRIFCHIRFHPLTTDQIQRADTVNIAVLNYDWKIGRLGSFQGHGFNINVADQKCGQSEATNS